MSHADISIERIRGPHDGVLELILVQSADWESDPFLVKMLREKIASYQNYLISEEFRGNYVNCRAVIVLETSHFPPEEIQQLLAKEGVEVRIAKSMGIPEGVDQVRETSSGVVEFVFSQPAAWDSDPFLVKTLKEKISDCRTYIKSDAFRDAFPGVTGVIILDALFAPPTEVQHLLMKAGAEIQVGGGPLPVSSKSAPAAAKPVPAAAKPAPAAAKPAPEAAKPMFVQRKPIIDEDYLDDDPYDAFEGSPQSGGVPPIAMVSGALCVLFLLGMVYGLFSSSPTAKNSSPKVIQASAVTASGMPKESYATISVRPDRRSFVMIPIQSSVTGKQEFFFMFRSLESNKLLIFVNRKDSQILKQIKMVKHPVTDEEYPKPFWQSDLLGDQKKISKRTYTGRLEWAQRRKNGPVVVALPDQNRNLNKVYFKLNIKFPKDTMVLVVGKKPHPEGGHSGLIMLICFLGAVITGGFGFVSFNQSKRAF